MLGDSRVLLLDADPDASRTVSEALAHRCGTTVLRATTLRAARAALRRTGIDVVVTELHLPDASGVTVVRTLRERHPAVPVVVLAGRGSEELAAESMRWGGHRYLAKRDDYPTLVAAIVDEILGAVLLDRVEQDACSTRAATATWGAAAGSIVSASPAMASVMALVARAARSRATVLIEGETGTGKELIARALHAGGPARSRPFRVQNCAALSETLLEAELFGHVRGTFTGAERDRAGLFLDARDGTVFLDEIGDAPPSLQAKLLRVLQHGEVKAVGADRATRAEARVVAATHRRLADEVAAGRFRADLYYRLSVFPIRIPALRHRPEDVQPLLTRSLARYERLEARTTGGFTPDAFATLERYPWPGNVRELEHEVHRLVLTLPQGVPIERAHLAPRIRTAEGPAPGEPLGRILRRVELAVIEDRVRRAPTKAAAARSLGITREALYWKLRRLGATDAGRG